MRIIVIFEENEPVNSYDEEFVATIASRLSYDNLMIFNPPKKGLRDSRYGELKYQLIYKLQYLIRHK